MPTPWGPAEGYSQGLGQEVRGRGPPAEADGVVRDAGAGLTIADRLADSGERVALGTGREARTRRPWRNRAQCQRGRSGAQHSAATAPPASRRAPRSPAGPAREPARAICPRKARPPARLLCLHLLPARPGPPQTVLGEPDTWWWGRPQGTAWAPAAAWLPALSRYTGLWGPGRGGRAPGPVPNTWLGRGASLQAPNPGFGASGSEGGADCSGFPRSPLNHTPPQPSPARPLPSPPRAARGVAVRGLAFREREGAWPSGFALKWLQSAARGSGRGRRDRAVVAVRVGPTGPNRTRH